MRPKSSVHIYIIVICILLTGYGVFQPKLSSFIPLIRSTRLNRFIHQTIDTGRVHDRSLWQLREWYSPGMWEILPNHFFQTVKFTDQSRFQNWLSSACEANLYARYLGEHAIAEVYTSNHLCTFENPTKIEPVFCGHSDCFIVSTDVIYIATKRDFKTATSSNGFLAFDEKLYQSNDTQPYIITITRFDR
jgi:hypothetical protein